MLRVTPDARLVARPRVDRRMGQLMAGDQDGVVHVWSGHVAPQVLPEELRSADRVIALSQLSSAATLEPAEGFPWWGALEAAEGSPWWEA